MSFKKFLFLILLIMSTAGCKTTNFTSYDPSPISGSNLFVDFQSEQNSINFIWLPPAYSPDFLPYTSMFTSDVKSFADKYGYNYEHEVNQSKFNENANSFGGLFDSKSGQMNTLVLTNSIKKTASDIFASDDSIHVIAFIMPVKEIVQSNTGLTIWSNTEQKSQVIPNSSRQTKEAISLKVNYLFRDDFPESIIIGLDAEDERFLSKDKYDDIVSYIFTPFLINHQSSL
uniref:hypothetical protein n=1 Tax=Ningiella ruwaisensis TaxID=2364274 RepID=UPI00109FD03E|nr:hypothetical protein [Ningiella ruwaisensis]